MDAIKPDEPTNPGWELRTYATEQRENYNPLPVVRNRSMRQCPVMSAWQMTEEELAYIQLCIAEQRPVVLYHEQWTFDSPLQPIRMFISKPFYQDGPWAAPEPGAQRTSTGGRNGDTT
jgi:hypothetical protein